MIQRSPKTAWDQVLKDYSEELRDRLSAIKVLFRAPDTLSLYGLPYRMRPGQQPGDLWRARRDYVPAPIGWYGAPQVSLDDWIWLGCPGWWCDWSQPEYEMIEAYLAKCECVPSGPYEWCDV